MTRQIVAASQLLDIECLDHLVIGQAALSRCASAAWASQSSIPSPFDICPAGASALA